jgi:hypothetical protein
MVAIRWLCAWALYVLGDAISYMLKVPDSWPMWWFDIFYAPYNRLMCTSSRIQGDGPGPWHKVIWHD